MYNLNIDPGDIIELNELLTARSCRDVSYRNVFSYVISSIECVTPTYLILNTTSDNIIEIEIHEISIELSILTKGSKVINIINRSTCRAYQISDATNYYQFLINNESIDLSKL